MKLTWENSAWEFKDQSPQIAILPLANLNCHGLSLPVCTDQVIVSEVAKSVSEILPGSVFLLPTWPLGTAPTNQGLVRTVVLESETLWAVVHDIVLSLYDHGIKQIAVINNHGSTDGTSAWPTSNTVVKTAIRQLNYETSGLTAIWVQPFTVGRHALENLFPKKQTDEIELSLLLHLSPGVVKQGADNQMVINPSEQIDNELLTAKGKLAFDVIVRSTVEYIENTFSRIGEMKKNG